MLQTFCRSLSEIIEDATQLVSAHTMIVRALPPKNVNVSFNSPITAQSVARQTIGLLLWFLRCRISALIGETLALEPFQGL